MDRNKLRLGVIVLFALALTACGHPSSDSAKQQVAQEIIETGETEEEMAEEPVTGEDNEEWAAYKALLTGDFSGIENMDNRMDPYNDNNPEFESDDFFRTGYEGALVSYQEGNPILLWSDTLDANYYQLPLKNGKFLDIAASEPVPSKSIFRLGTEFEYIYEKQYTLLTIDYDEYSKSRYDGWLDNYGVSEEGEYYFYQDYYGDGQMRGGIIRLSEEEWKQRKDVIDDLLIPKSEWKSCIVFTPNPNRSPITSV